MAEAAVQPRVTEAGPIEAVAAAPVGTVALLTAVLAIEAFGAAWGKGGGSLDCSPRRGLPPKEMLQWGRH